MAKQADRVTIGVLHFLAAHRPRQRTPQKVSVETKDRYLMDLLVRHFSKRTGRGAQVWIWKKEEDAKLRAAIEETELLGQKPVFLVLGAPKGFAKSLKPSKSAYVISQEEGGKLVGEKYAVKDRGLILKALRELIGLPWDLRDLKSLDWSWAEGWHDYEPLLYRGKLLTWDFMELRREIQDQVRGELLSLIRDREWWTLHWLCKRYGTSWVHRYVVEHTAALLRYHHLQERGLPAHRMGEFMDLPDWRADEVRDGVTRADLVTVARFARRIVRLDPLIQSHPQIGLDLLFLGAKV